MNSKNIGSTSELVIATILSSKGYDVLFPYGDNSRYDLVFDDRGSFFKVQCKTGRLEQGAVVFNTASIFLSSNRKAERRDYSGEVDFLGVYCPCINFSYLIPIKNVNKTTMHLRVDKAKNGQEKNITYASDYEIFMCNGWERDNRPKLTRTKEMKCFFCCNIYYSYHNKSKFCSKKCYRFACRKTNRPSKEELHDIVWSKPTIHVASQFGVSDNTISKWCKQYGINKPPRGYWQKINK